MDPGRPVPMTAPPPTSTAVPSSKAAGFATVVSILRELADAPAFTRFTAALPVETAALIEVPPIAIEWLPIDHFYALVDTAERVLFAGDTSRVVDLGRRSIAHDLGTIYRAFIRLATPELTLTRTAKMWSAYNRDHGSLTVVMRGTDVADVTYDGIPSRAPGAFWNYQLGALRAVVEATGLHNVSTRMLAPAKGSTSRTIRIVGR
jgi:hypothetical protein